MSEFSQIRTGIYFKKGVFFKEGFQGLEKLVDVVVRIKGRTCLLERGKWRMDC